MSFWSNFGHFGGDFPAFLVILVAVYQNSYHSGPSSVDLKDLELSLKVELIQDAAGKDSEKPKALEDKYSCLFSQILEPQIDSQDKNVFSALWTF